jgi:WD40 repeat protein
MQGDTCSTGRLDDHPYKAVSFYGEDESKMVCQARHSLVLVNVETRTMITALSGATHLAAGKLRKSVTCLATHPNQRLVVVGTVSGYIEFYDFSAPDEKVGDLKLGGQLIERMEFSPDGQTLAIAASNKKVYLMNMATRSVTDSIEPQRSRILSVSFNQAANRLVSVSEDKTVALINIVKE